MRSRSQRSGRRRSLNRIAKFIASTKSGKPCEHCHVVYKPWQMQYDHIDHTTKKQTVAKCKTYTSAMEEIKKCRLLCANCHADVSYQDRYLYRVPTPVEPDNQLSFLK